MPLDISNFAKSQLDIAELPSSQIVSSVVEGVPFTGYGNSYMWMNQAPLFAQRRYFDRLGLRFRSGSTLNNGVNGLNAFDTANLAHNTTTAVTNHGTVAISWTPAATNGGVVILEVVRNDAGWDGFSNSGKARAGFTNALDTLIRLIRASSVLQDTNAAFAYTGTWTNTAGIGYPGGNVHSTTTNNDKVTITTPVGTDFDLVVLGFDTSFNGAAFSLTVDAVNWIPTLTAGGYPTTTAGVFNQSKTLSQSWMPITIPLRGLSNAAHTVVLTHNDTSGKLLYVNRLLTPSPTPPTIVIPKCAQLLPLGYSSYVGANASWTIDQAYNALIDAEVARWPNDQSVVAWDPNTSGWDPASMIYSGDGQGLHTNDGGSACYANGIAAVLNGLRPRSGLITV